MRSQFQGIVNIVSQTVCAREYKKAANIKEFPIALLNVLLRPLSDNQICAGTQGVDVCFGDSGGPLMLMDEETEQWSVIGTTSFGWFSCEEEAVPSVYSRIDMFLDWIKNNM